MQTTPQLPKRDTRFKRKTGDEVHASGTIIHWDVRAPDDPYGSIGIACHGCRQERVAPKASIKNLSWYGLCSDCIRGGKIPKKLTGKEKLDSGAIVDWDRIDPNNPRHRMVACPNFPRCGNETSKRIDAGNKNSQPFYCRPCFIEYRRSRLAAAWGAQSEIEEKKGGAEREAVAAIETVWRRVRSLDQSLEKRLKLVTGVEVATELRLGEAHSEKGADQLRKKLAKDGVPAKFPNAKRWFPAFVKRVVERLEATGK